MKPVWISLLKNILLVVLVVLTILSFWNGMFKWKDLLGIQILIGLLYIFLSYYELSNTVYKASLPLKRYGYFPYSFFMFKTIKAFFFISFALMLISSGTKVKYLYPICLIIAAAELIVMFFKYSRKLCFVSFYANYLLFSKNTMFQIFASEIESVEFRHEIFYIVLKNKGAEDVRLMNVENKDQFISDLLNWLEKNSIQLNEESKLNLTKYSSTR